MGPYSQPPLSQQPPPPTGPYSQPPLGQRLPPPTGPYPRGPVEYDEKRALAILVKWFGSGDGMERIATFLTHAVFKERLSDYSRQDRRNGYPAQGPYIFGVNECRSVWIRLRNHADNMKNNTIIPDLDRMTDAMRQAVDSVKEKVDKYEGEQNLKNENRGWVEQMVED